MFSSGRIETANALTAILIVLSTGLAARAQALSVIPVNILLTPGQRATTLTITNQGASETAIQIRAYTWSQKDGNDQLAPTDAVVVSPPLASIAAGATQVVRLILRQPPVGSEATYRILIDQIPPPAEAGVVHVVLRLSIPIFAQPMTRALAHIQFHTEKDAGQLYLVGTNDGLRHEAIRDIALLAADGGKLKLDAGASPYILAGSTRRWHFTAQDALPLPGESLRLTAHGDAGVIEQQVPVAAQP